MDVARPVELEERLFAVQRLATAPVGTTVTVKANECCIVLKNGRSLIRLDAGRWTLDPATAPFLGGCVEPGGHMGTLDLVFVDQRQVSMMRFGGRLGELRDGATGEVATAFVLGAYDLDPTDPSAIAAVAVTNPDAHAFMSMIGARLVQAAQTVVGGGLASGQLTFDGIPEALGSLAGQITPEASEQVSGFGVRVTSVAKLAINLNDRRAGPGQGQPGPAQPVTSGLHGLAGTSGTQEMGGGIERKAGEKSRRMVIGCVIAAVVSIVLAVVVTVGAAAALYLLG